MGAIISRFRKKKTTIEQLDDIEQKIKSIEKFQKETEQQFRRVIGKLVLSSILVYIAALAVYYYYFSPDTFKENIFKFMPLLIFPVAIYLTRRILSWYYKRKLAKNETSLKSLKVTKKKMLDEVMDKEVYKVAKEILEKFAPEQLNKDSVKPIIKNEKSIVPINSRSDMVARQRIVPTPVNRFNGTTPLPDVAFQAVPNSNQLQPRLSLPRPVLPRNRGAFDKLIDMVIGDGPGNRYALICRMCSSHNGMALKHEFEYLAFRCAYCLQWNPARKQRPHAPNLRSDTGSQDESDANNSEIDLVDTSGVSSVLKSDHDEKSVPQSDEGTINQDQLLDNSEKPENSPTDAEKETVESVPDLIGSFDMTTLKAAVDEADKSPLESENESQAIESDSNTSPDSKPSLR
ncbi:endoplasmic reticulum junction formation protein lunapark-B [Planococcus citri]|uniref:endoplasmic reticulum junction formation protein lunapark-B n=1 Tax=Planococcus citri TaxID=170843 RepID=UPI0031F9B136